MFRLTGTLGIETILSVLSKLDRVELFVKGALTESSARSAAGADILTEFELVKQGGPNDKNSARLYRGHLVKAKLSKESKTDHGLSLMTLMKSHSFISKFLRIRNRHVSKNKVLCREGKLAADSRTMITILHVRRRRGQHAPYHPSPVPFCGPLRGEILLSRAGAPRCNHPAQPAGHGSNF